MTYTELRVRFAHALEESSRSSQRSRNGPVGRLSDWFDPRADVLCRRLRWLVLRLPDAAIHLVSRRTYNSSRAHFAEIVQGGAVEHLHAAYLVDLAYGPYRLCSLVSEEAGGSAPDKW